MSIAAPIVLELEGMYDDTLVEDAVLAGTGYTFVQARISLEAPTSAVPEDIRNRTLGLFIFRRFLRAEDIALFPNLKVVVRMGVGYDRLDRVALAARGIKACNIPDYGTMEVADHAMALALSLRRGILLHHDLQRGTPPAPWTTVNTPLVQRPQGSPLPVAHLLTDPPPVATPRTFGILGLGRIGTAVALRAKAFGWRVLFYDPYLPNGVDRALGISRSKSLESLFRESHILSIHTPLTHNTRKLVNERLLRLMPPKQGVLINTARGGIVDLDGLLAVLRDDHLAGAGLDVLPEEDNNDITRPDAKVHPLIEAYRAREKWLEGRFVVTPHSAFHSPESWDDIRSLSAITMKEVLVDGKETNVISPDTE
ncbi:4-phosphoerythronate dehydrogenase [Exidia glandulosa HHB12029]|uniref:4-phosphoerythronate dehydrogenase n=1 Tax=Exidia glandulosa HHB12029 TaxID=1314781 RepID=A0A166B2D3_EXIGL|nr:4-phosphoerythronate dehydrogenase [Exidia glandulosa HHB12029]